MGARKVTCIFQKIEESPVGIRMLSQRVNREHVLEEKACTGTGVSGTFGDIFIQKLIRLCKH